MVAGAKHQDVLDQPVTFGDDTQWGGRGPEYEYTKYQGGGLNDPGGYRTMKRPAQSVEDVQRYQGMGAAAAQRGAYQLDYAAANRDRSNAEFARDAQVDATSLQRQAAYGQAPSRAEILGRQMAGQSLDAQMAGAASARGGPLAQAAAMRSAAGGAGAFQQQSINQLSALRADEMARARDAYFSSASGIRAGDYTGADQAARMAQAQGQMELAQRQLNQQGQMGYEQMGFNVNDAALRAGLEREKIKQGIYQHNDLMAQGEADREQRERAAWMNAGTTLGAGMMSIRSDERMKDPLPLFEPEGKQLHQSLDGKAFYADEPTDGGGASLSGPTPTFSRAAAAKAATSTKAEPAKQRRAMTPEELMRAADAMGRKQSEEHDARMKAGPAVDPIADANRAQAAQPYAYKPEFRPPEQAPGEVNVGPMAQNMAANPVAATAVRRDPGTGLLVLDKDKLAKLQSAGIASLQRQMDSLRSSIAQASEQRRAYA